MDSFWFFSQNGNNSTSLLPADGHQNIPILVEGECDYEKDSNGTT